MDTGLYLNTGCRLQRVRFHFLQCANGKRIDMKRWFAGFTPCTARHAVLIAIAITLPSSASLAQGTRAQRMACSGDVWRLCSSAIPSVDRIVACLKRERARLSPGCQAVFNDAEAQAASNRPAATPGKATPHAQPEQAASTTAAPAKATPHVQPEQAASAPAATPGKVTPHVQQEQAASTPAVTPGKATPHAQPEQAASTPAAPVATAQGGAGAAATEQPQIVTRSLSAAPSEDVASAAQPTLFGAGRTMAAPSERVASRDVDSTTPVSSRHGRQQRVAYHQSSHHGRSGNRYGGIMQEMAPLIAMAMGGGQGGGGFDVGSMMGGQGGQGGRGNFDVGQIMGMARNMGFDPGTLMGGGGGGGYWR